MFVKTALSKAKTVPFWRKFGTSAVRNSDHDTSGIYGTTLPFGTENKYLLALGFIAFFGSGMAIPFLVLRRVLLKENN